MRVITSVWLMIREKGFRELRARILKEHLHGILTSKTVAMSKELNL